MKRILLFLLLLVVGLIIFSMVQLVMGPENPVQVGLNLFYYFSLFLALIGFRLSLIGREGFHPAVLILTLLTIGLLTYEWLFPQTILSIGNISLGLFALQFGLVLMLLVRTEGKGSRLVQMIIALTTILIASLAFLKLENELSYAIGGGMLALTCIAALIFLFSRKTS